MHSKNIDKCRKNPQSARRKPNYNAKCGKNCHKILSVCNEALNTQNGWASRTINPEWRPFIFYKEPLIFNYSIWLYRITNLMWASVFKSFANLLARGSGLDLEWFFLPSLTGLVSIFYKLLLLWKNVMLKLYRE